MSLTSITKFFNYRPHLSNRFTCSLFVGTKGNEYLQFNVQSVNVTELESEASNAAVYFGNGYVTIPIINTASRKIEIVFEETNTMEVSYILDSIMADHFHGTPRVIAIGIKEYDDRFVKIHSARLYYCLLSSWEEPQFSRTGNPGIVTVSATFNVMSEEAWTTGKAPKSGLGAVTVKQLKDSDKVEEKPPVADIAGSEYKPPKFIQKNLNGSFDVNGKHFANEREYKEYYKNLTEGDRLNRWERQFNAWREREKVNHPEWLDADGNWTEEGKEKARKEYGPNHFTKPSVSNIGEISFELKMNAVANEQGVSAVMLEAALLNAKANSGAATNNTNKLTERDWNRLSADQKQAIIENAKQKQAAFINENGENALLALDIGYNENFSKIYGQIDGNSNYATDCSTFQERLALAHADVLDGTRDNDSQKNVQTISCKNMIKYSKSGGNDGANPGTRLTNTARGKAFDAVYDKVDLPPSSAQSGDVFVKDHHTMKVVSVESDGSAIVIESANGGVRVAKYTKTELSTYRVYYREKTHQN